MEHREFQSPETLQDSIRCFWYNRKDFGKELSEFEVVPDGYAEIIFHFGGECSLSHNGILKPLPTPFMMGLINRPVLFYARNRLEIIGVRCFPWTVFDLLGLPSGKGGLYVFEHPIAQLQTELNECILADKVEDAIALVKQYFLHARMGIATDSMLYKAGEAMKEVSGTLQGIAYGNNMD